MNQNLMQKKLPPGVTRDSNYRDDFEIILKYCKIEDINTKNQRNLYFKAQFLTKMQALQTNGKKLELAQKYDCELDDIVDKKLRNKKFKVDVNQAMKMKSKMLEQVEKSLDKKAVSARYK